MYTAKYNVDKHRDKNIIMDTRILNLFLTLRKTFCAIRDAHIICISNIDGQ